MALVAYDQSWWWRIKDDYGFGWLVPVFAGYVIYDRWPVILAAITTCTAPGSPRMSGAAGRIVAVILWLGLVGAALFALLGVSFRVSYGGHPVPATLAITLGLAATGPLLIFLTAPSADETTPVPWRQDARWALAAKFVFPTAVWLISAPLYSELEDAVRLFLLSKVVSVVSFVFGLLGLAVEQQGNILILPNGSVGVEDACSGIRSLTGCLFAGSFLAAVFLDRWWKKIALVVCAMGLAFVTNLIRALFLTAWAYNNGPRSISGAVHDIAGYAVLGLTTLALLCLIPLFNLRIDTVREVKNQPAG